jgi:peptide deformylase
VTVALYVPKVRPILLWPSKVLRTPAALVKSEIAEWSLSLRELLEDMKATMYAANGVGLAAPQIGVPLAVVVIDTRESTGVKDKDRRLIEAINPRLIEERSDAVRQPEGCLSVCPGVTALVDRGSAIEVEYTTPDGQLVRETAGGLLARAWCHELDHLDGKVYLFHLGMIERRRIEKACADNARKMGATWVPGATLEKR